MLDLKQAIEELSCGYIKFQIYKDCCITEEEVVALLKHLAELEKADMEEVVRCKECRFWGGVTFGNVCRYWSALQLGMKRCSDPDDFCSHGERKERTECDGN